MIKKIVWALGLCCCVLVSCKKETETLQMTAISEYAPLITGKYITYQLDSFRYLPFSTQSIIISFQVKYQVDSQVTDNSGRPAYRILRFIRKNPTNAWEHDNTFMAVNTGSSLEFVENNFRFIKLKQPFRDTYTWKGNSYINTNSGFSEVRYLDDWDYEYDSVNAPLQLGAITFDSTLKVNQRDDIIGFPNDPTVFSEINFGVEYYAKGIGLIYRKFFHSEYQPPTTSGGTGYYTNDSKGVTLTLIDHN